MSEAEVVLLVLLLQAVLTAGLGICMYLRNKDVADEQLCDAG